MLKKIYTLLLSLIVVSGFSQEKINWISMQEAIDLTAKPGNKKKIFIDAYTDWCGWCKRMDQSTFIDSNVIKHMNENYYAVKFDAESYDTITKIAISCCSSQQEKQITPSSSVSATFNAFHTPKRLSI